MIGDPEDPPPNARSDELLPSERPTLDPPALPVFPAEATEKTNPGIRTTLQIPKAQLDALNAAIAEQHKASTAEIVGALDRGVTALFDELAALRGDMQKNHNDVKLWLFGFGTDGDGRGQQSIAQDLGFTREQADSALAAVSKITPRLDTIERRIEATLRVAKAAYNVTLRGPNAVTEDERAAIEAIK